MVEAQQQQQLGENLGRHGPGQLIALFVPEMDGAEKVEFGRV